MLDDALHFPSSLHHVQLSVVLAWRRVFLATGRFDARDGRHGATSYGFARTCKG